MKKWKLSFTIFLMILGCCFTKVIALETLEQRFQVQQVFRHILN